MNKKFKFDGDIHLKALNANKYDLYLTISSFGILMYSVHLQHCFCNIYHFLCKCFPILHNNSLYVDNNFEFSVRLCPKC